MKLLTVDPAAPRVTAAFSNGGEVLGWRTLEPGALLTTLAPALEELLADVAITVAALDTVACCIGPGPYNPLRIGVSMSKGLATVHQTPMVTMSAFQLLYMAASPGDQASCLVPAGRGHYAVAVVSNIEGIPQVTGEPDLIPRGELPAGSYLVDEGFPEPEVAGSSFTPISAAARMETATRLAVQLADRQRFENLERVQPFYSRGPSITISPRIHKSAKATSP